MTTFEEASRKARYGHRDWIAFKGKDGQFVYEPFSREGVKRALLAVGTKGHFTLLAASTAVGHRYNWPMGLLAMRNARFLMNRRAA